MQTTQIPRGITLVELLVVLFVLFVLASLAIPCCTPALVKGQMTQSLSNEKQIHLATFNMANDRITDKNSAIGWPGDLVASGTMACKVTDFVKVLVKNDYLKPGDLKIFASAGIKLFTDSDANNFSATPGPGNNCAFTVFCVQESDASSAIFLSTINATLNVSNTTFVLDSNADPFRGKGYVVFHRGGDGSILNGKQAGRPAFQGTPCKLALTGTAALQAM